MDDIASLTLEALKDATEFLHSCQNVLQTPVLKDAQFCFNNELLKNCELNFKLESMQYTGSFKIRGVENQFRRLAPLIADYKGVATYSGGNYGKAFATVVNRFNTPSVVTMPHSAPADRNMNILESKAIEYSTKGMLYLNPFDDMDLIRGYGSVAFEFLRSVPEPDVVIVPCGGGGLISGVSAALRLSGYKRCKIYGVNPETATAMYDSFKIGRAAKVTNPHSVAGGLCPPSAGKYTYACCRKYVDEILLVNDEQIIAAVAAFFKLGLIVEPAGAAGLAALLNGKVPEDLSGKTVMVVVSGGNITMPDLEKLLERT